MLTGLTGPQDARVRDRIIADTHGNPLALLELTRGLTPAQLSGGFGRSSAVPLDGRIEESFGRQLETLPAQTQRLLQLAAADPTGDPVLVWRAAGRLAIGAGAAGPAVEAGWRSWAPGCGSGIRWCARRPTGRHRSRRGRSCTARWPRSPTRLSILIGGPGTGLRPRPGRMRTLLPNLNSARAGPSAAVVSRRRRRSWSGPPG